MVLVTGGSLSQDDVPRLSKQKSIELHYYRGVYTYTDEDCEVLAEVLQATAVLETLHLSDRSVIALKNSKFIKALAKNRTIKTLNFDWARCGDEGAKALAAVLKENTTIENIDLDRNEISDVGAKAFAAALKENDTLQTLNLVRNNISDVGAKALAAALKVNASIQELYLDRNEIGYVGAAALAAALKENITLKQLTLDFNNIREKGGEDILHALQQNGGSPIEYITLYGNKVTPETLTKIGAEINRINNSVRTGGVDEGEVATGGLAGEPNGDDNERPSNKTGQDDNSTERAQLAREKEKESAATTETDIDEPLATVITQLQKKNEELQDELGAKEEVIMEKDELIATKDRELASKNATLKKIGMMANGKDSETNLEGGGREDPQAVKETEQITDREKELQ